MINTMTLDYCCTLDMTIASLSRLITILSSYSFLATLSPHELILANLSQGSLLLLIVMLGCVTQRTQLPASVHYFLLIIAGVIDAIVEVLANIILLGG
jgi:hypothetical protein